MNKWDFWGRTPLYSAVDLNTLPRGGRPDLPSTDHLTGYDIAEMLLKKGANPNIQLKLRPPYRNGVFDRGGDQVISTGATPLLVAAKIGRREVGGAAAQAQRDRRSAELQWRYAVDGGGRCGAERQPDSRPVQDG